MSATVRIALTAASLSILTPWVSTAAELRHLQGSWEGVSEGHEAEGKVSITVTGNTLYFRGLKPTQRYAATVTLPAGTAPQQLHATLKDGPSPKEIGTVVYAILKIENGTLTLAGISASDAQSPRRAGHDPFENNSMFRYDLRRVPRK